jgi:UDP:flavonoid glycosyltransferase YjiC (YdhE family)
MAATAGRIDIHNTPANARVVDFLPGTEAAKRAALVICNGGSPTTYQALAEGTPVLGLVSNNMDQHLNMAAVRRAGAGEILRARDADAPRIRALVIRMLQTTDYAVAAARLTDAHRKWKSAIEFARLLDDVLAADRTSRERAAAAASSA